MDVSGNVPVRSADGGYILYGHPPFVGEALRLKCGWAVRRLGGERGDGVGTSGGLLLMASGRDVVVEKETQTVEQRYKQQHIQSRRHTRYLLP